MTAYKRLRPNMKLLTKIGDAFYARRHQQGLTLEDMAGLTGLSYSTIRRAELGFEEIRLVDFNKMLKALDLTLEDLKL